MAAFSLGPTPMDTTCDSPRSPEYAFGCTDTALVQLDAEQPKEALETLVGLVSSWDRDAGARLAAAGPRLFKSASTIRHIDDWELTADAWEEDNQTAPGGGPWSINGSSEPENVKVVMAALSLGAAGTYIDMGAGCGRHMHHARHCLPKCAQGSMVVGVEYCPARCEVAKKVIAVRSKNSPWPAEIVQAPTHTHSAPIHLDIILYAHPTPPQPTHPHMHTHPPCPPGEHP
jgi:hypothetical protein